MLAALALWSLVPLVVLLLDSGGRVFNGSDGLQVSDHLQYLSLIRDAGENILVSNRFDVVEDPHLFLHPMLALSGLAWKLGASIQLSYLLWKPVAVLVLWAGFAAYVRRLFGADRAGGLAALGLALFFLTPATYAAEWLGGSPELRFGTAVVGLETYAADYPWGGYTGTVSIALVPLFLLGIERVLDPARRAPGRSVSWYAICTGLAGMLASWLHPWQGIILLVIVAGLVVWERFDRRHLNLVGPAALTALPLAYLFVLSHTDSSWAFVSQTNDYPHFGNWLALGFAPAVLALPALFGGPLDVQERLLRLWPAAALVVYLALQSSWFYHAFAGLSLPLAVLAVRTWSRSGLPRWAAIAAVTVLIAPGLVFSVLELRETRDDHFLAPDERRALGFLDESSREGPVLARLDLGQAVPAFTGRNTYVGHYTWTPDYDARVGQAAELLAGRLPPPEARALVRQSKAAFVLGDCDDRAPLQRTLGPLLVGVRRIGCATVYEVR